MKKQKHIIQKLEIHFKQLFKVSLKLPLSRLTVYTESLGSYFVTKSLLMC